MVTISKILARPILDSRGEWTIEATLLLSSGALITASVPQGKSTGTYEAKTVSPKKAVWNIEHIILPRLKGKDPRNQRVIDELLMSLDKTPGKSRIGGNTMLAVSIAAARAGGIAKKIPLWKHIRSVSGLRGPFKTPRLYINVINGGLHAGNNLIFQEYLVIPRAKNISDAVRMGTALYQRIGEDLAKKKGKGATNVGDEGGYASNFTNAFEPFSIIRKVATSLGFASKIDLGLDAAASKINRPAHSLKILYQNMKSKFGLFYLEDPFKENDWKNFSALCKKTKQKPSITGDDLTVTNIRRMEEAKKKCAVNAVIIKPNQIGTVSEAIDAVRFARRAGWLVVASHRSGETNDDFIADFAYGVGADGLKLGAPARGERIAKYNRLLEIEIREE